MMMMMMQKLLVMRGGNDWASEEVNVSFWTLPRGPGAISRIFKVYVFDDRNNR